MFFESRDGFNNRNRYKRSLPRGDIILIQPTARDLRNLGRCASGRT